MIDSSIIVSGVKKRAEEEGYVHVEVIGAITKGEKGQEITEMGDMAMRGAMAFSDDGHYVDSAHIMLLAAKYAGINEKRNVVLSMTIAGALAGIGAGLYFLSGASEWNPQVSTALPAIGFNGIPVALLALSNPIGVIFAALFVAHISVGGAYLPTKYYQPEIADLIVAVIIYLCAFVTLFKGIVANLFKSKKEQKANANADNGKEEKK